MALQSPLSAPLPEPETVENLLGRDAQGGRGHAMKEPKHSPTHDSPFDQDKTPEIIRYPPIPLYTKSSCGHGRNTSQNSLTSTSSGTGICGRTRGFQLKSPYLGPVAWTVPARNSGQPSKPFLIYQDPPWLEPPDAVIDTWGYVAASDDKENCSHHQRHYSGSDVVAATTTEVSHIDGQQVDDAGQLVADNAVASTENIVDLAVHRTSSISPSRRNHPPSSSPLRQQHEELLSSPATASRIAPFFTSPGNSREDDYARSMISPPREFDFQRWNPEFRS